MTTTAASPIFAMNMHRENMSNRFFSTAAALESFALEVERIALRLDDSADSCTCCGTNRYRNFQQRQLRRSLMGTAERLRGDARTFRDGARDPAFIGAPPKPAEDTP